MTVLYSLLAAGISFLALALIFTPLERAFPAHPEQPIFRTEWATDLLFFLGQYLLWGGLTVSALHVIHSTLLPYLPASLSSTVGALPFPFQVLAALLASDLSVYWFHRLQHRIDWLWRFHAVHHTAEHLDWLAAHREHPLDGVATQFVINAPILLIGFPLSTISALVAFRGIWAIFIHSNVRLLLGPLRVLIGSPELHHWHHAKTRASCNFANLSPLMDVLFGTYRCPTEEPPALGIVEAYPRGYFAQLIYPFIRRKP